MQLQRIKSCLVISYGPVPTSQYQTIEGGGMRAWGLAKGLSSQGIDVTVAVNASFPQSITESEGIHLTNWSTDMVFIDLINSFDAVVASYCMGSDSVFIADHINDSVQLILDVYVPIYVEVSARDSNDLDAEYRAYADDIKRFNHVLRRGDYFLCASKVQKVFYTGVLGSLGIINPRSYRQDRILVVPFGLDNLPVSSTRNPYLELGIKEDQHTILWFGGLYPWFKVEELLGAIKDLSSEKNIKFVIVGGKNPFNQNPDFIKQYEFAYSYAEKYKLLNSSLFFVDWVDFNDRINWFTNADLVISINNPGEENSFSWRTRVMDFVWGEVPVITNGEDVLSEELLNREAAIRLNELSAKEISRSIKQFFKNPSLALNIKSNLKTVKEDYFWNKLVSPVLAVVNEGLTPSTDERLYRDKLSISNYDYVPKTPNRPSVIRALALMPRAARYYKNHGLTETLNLTKSIAGSKLSINITSHNYGRAKRYVFISHPINNTGAPLVLLQIIEETVKKYGANNVVVVAPHIDATHLRRLRESGVKIEVAVSSNSSATINSQLKLNKNDFVLINTIAVYNNYQKFIFDALSSKKLDEAFWFIHEDKSQLEPIGSDLVINSASNGLTELINSGRLHVFVPSKRVQDDYRKILGSYTVGTMTYHVDVPSEFKLPRENKDYGSINFLLSGTPADGRKGQFIAISAFYTFIKTYYEKDPSKYRDFNLILVAIGNDYISQQICDLLHSLLGDSHFTVFPSLSRQEALKVTRQCNAVICCSLNETFAIYVGEAMLMGCVVLRNGSAGMEEQLKDGVNGYYINEKDVTQFASVLEKLLNKKVPNKDVKLMGEASRDLIEPYTQNTYIDRIMALSQHNAPKHEK